MATHDGSSSSSSFSSSASASSSTHDVFLSFRGADTRNNFTGFLHTALKREGIDAFIDSEDLWGGEDIKSALLEAIRRSKVSIPVFSKGYADSKWCLMELVEIVRCHQSNGQIILPTFLDVDPADVRYQIGSFEGSFQKHMQRYDSQTVKSWKEALTLVAGFSGYELKQVNGNQSKLVKLIVERALSESSGNRLGDPNNPVGLDARVKEVEDLLNVGSNEIRFVGICGIGGIGKTTTAKALYNRIFKNFRRSSFLANIREEASGPKGLVSLQEQLISSVYKRKLDASIGNVHRGKELIIEKLQGENVLLVLDDVDCRSQLDALAIDLNWFGPTSKIVITSRDKHILELAKVGEGNIYWPTELDDVQSLQLFSLHAFSSDQPLEEYIQLSHDVIHLTGGLPLTLEVLGSSLFGIREIDVWQSMLRKLKKIPNREVHQTLKISYDNLDDDEKSMFLDAACFFIGWRKDTVISMWEACGFEAILAIKKLTQRSLLKFTNKVSYGTYRESINSYDELSMHDQIQAMGREIVLEGSRTEPSERSRLWSRDDILEVLEEHMGTPMIEGILPSVSHQSPELFSSTSVLVYKEDFAKMSKLRYLNIDGAKSEVEFPHLPFNLRWLSWKNCFRDLPIDFYHKKLFYMDLSGGHIKQAWRNKPRNENQRFQNLKVLNLKNCWQLSESPDFSWFPNLEELDLQNCKYLINLHKSIGDLKSLVKLCIFRTGVKELPDSICLLSSLKYLNLSFCYLVEKLPESIGELKSLVELDFRSTKIEKLPDSIWKLSSLKRLFLGRCLVRRLSESIGDLKSLVELDLSQTYIEELPDSISRLSCLERLDLYLCPSLTKLPESFGNLNSLVSLRIQMVSTRLESLPEFPSNLTHLEVENFSSLRIADLSSLKKLRKLLISGCRMLEEIRGLEETKSLEEFFMFSCDIIESIPKLPSNLVTLRVVTSNSVRKLPDLSGLKKLRKLDLRNCRNLEEIHGLEGTESLEEFYMHDNGAMELVPKLPSTLNFIVLEGCDLVKKLPDLSSLKNLRTLRTRFCERLEEIPGIGGTESLAVFDLDDCNALTDTPRKILGQGRLLVDESQITESLNVNDGIYKGLSLCLVFALEAQGNVEEGQPVIIRIYPHASVHGKDRSIQCVINLRIESLKYTTGKDIIYIHHFKGFDWFGLPLEGKDAIEIRYIKADVLVPGPCQSIGCKVKFWKLLLENKASEQEQMTDQEECSARMVADFFSWSFDNARRSPSDTIEELHMVSPQSSNDGESSSHGDGESSSNGNGDSSYHDCGSSSYGDDDSSYHDCESSYEDSEDLS